MLPFTNMSGDPEQEYFADGVADDIITALSRCNWLFVIARNSSFTYKGKAVDTRQVGRELGVRYLLEGSVRRSSDRLRFTGQLIDAISGTNIWADRFEGQMSDVFDLQDRMTESVVAAIEPNLQRAEIERLKQKPTANLDAYDLLLRAQQLEYEFTAEPCGRHPVSGTDLLPRSQLCAGDGAGGLLLWSASITAGPRLAAEPPRVSVWPARPRARQDDSNVLWMAALATLRLAMDAKRAKELAYSSLGG